MPGLLGAAAAGPSEDPIEQQGTQLLERARSGRVDVTEELRLAYLVAQDPELARRAARELKARRSSLSFVLAGGGPAVVAELAIRAGTGSVLEERFVGLVLGDLPGLSEDARRLAVELAAAEDVATAVAAIRALGQDARPDPAVLGVLASRLDDTEWDPAGTPADWAQWALWRMGKPGVQVLLEGPGDFRIEPDAARPAAWAGELVLESFCKAGLSRQGRERTDRALTEHARSSPELVTELLELHASADEGLRARLEPILVAAASGDERILALLSEKRWDSPPPDSLLSIWMERGLPDAVASDFVRGLSAPRSRQRIDWTAALERHTPPVDGVVELLIRTSREDRHPKVRAKASLAAAAYGAAAVDLVPGLIERLGSSDAPAVEQAAFELGQIGPGAAAAAGALLDLLRESPDDTIVRTALARLGPAAWPAVFARVCEDPSVGVPEIDGVGTVERRALPECWSELDSASLERVLRTWPDPWLDERADDVIALLRVRLLDDEPSPRARAVRALGLFVPGRSIELVREALYGEEPVRRALVSVCREDLRPASTQLLIELANDPEPAVAFRAIDALGTAPRDLEHAWGTLEQAARSRDHRVRSSALVMLSLRTGHPETVEHLATLVRNGNGTHVKTWAAQRLGEAHVGSPAVLRALSTGLRGADIDSDRIALACAEALEQLGSLARPVTGDLVRALLSHPDPRTRAACARALGSLGTPSVVPALAAAAVHDGPAWSEPRFAVHRRNERTRPALSSRTDPRPAPAPRFVQADVRLAVLAALEALGPDAAYALPALRLCVRDPDSRVAAAAGAALAAVER